MKILYEKKRYDSFKYNQSSGFFMLEVMFVVFRWEDLYFPWIVIQINNGPMDQPIPDTSKEKEEPEYIERQGSRYT